MGKEDKHWGFLTTTLITAALALTITVFYASREPHAEGKSLSAWLREPQSDNRDRALNAIGTNALPWLKRWATSPDKPPPWQQKTILFLRRNTPWRWTFLEPCDRQEMGLLGFYALGSNAASAAPIMLHYLTHSSAGKRAMAIAILDQIGAPGIQCLTEALRTSTDAHWPYMATALRKIGVADEAATGLLLERIANSKVTNDRVIGLNALGVTGRGCARTIPFLEASLSDPSPIVVDAAMATLCSLGTNAQPAIQLLLACTNSTSNGRVALVQNLRFVERDAAWPHLIAFLHDEDRRVRSAAVTEIATFAPEHPEVVPLLLQELRHPDNYVTTTCIYLLKKLRGSRHASPSKAANAVTSGLLSLYSDLKGANTDSQLDPRLAKIARVIEEIDPEVAVIAGLVPPDKYPWVRVSP